MSNTIGIIRLIFVLITKISTYQNHSSLNREFSATSNAGKEVMKPNSSFGHVAPKRSAAASLLLAPQRFSGLGLVSQINVSRFGSSNDQYQSVSAQRKLGSVTQVVSG